MTPKEKAIELVEKFKFSSVGFQKRDEGITCALIAVYEILEVLGGAGVYGFVDPKVEQYYENVKHEIEKL